MFRKEVQSNFFFSQSHNVFGEMGWVFFLMLLLDRREDFASSEEEGKCKLKVNLVFRLPALKIIKICYLDQSEISLEERKV